MPLELLSIDGLPGIRPEHHLGDLLGEKLGDQVPDLHEGDILCVAQKVVSKAEGRSVVLEAVDPGNRARKYALETGRDPRVIQTILDHSRRIITVKNSVIIAETPHGFVCANAGLDLSNVERKGTALTLPENPDRSARNIRGAIRDRLGASPGVLITDTWGRPWREGQVNFAIGVAGLRPMKDYRGRKDHSGRPLTKTRIAVADEIAAAAELLMGKTREIPAVLLRGYDARGEGTARDLIRPAETDFFR